MKLLITIFLGVLTAWTGFAQTPVIVNYTELKPLLHKQNDTTYLVNFWATWCSPCVEELPYLEAINEKYEGDEAFKMLLISLDFKRHLDSRLIPFIEENKLDPEVILLSDTDANYWINDIDSSWTGAIPATLIYRNKQRWFKEGSITFQEIDSVLINHFFKTE